MNKMNDCICFFNSHPTWGGGEKWHAETAEYLFEKKYITLVCAYAKGALYKRLVSKIPCEKVYFSNRNFLNPFAYFQAYRILKKHKVTTIILCLPIDLKVAGIVAKFLGIRNIIYRRGSAIPIKDSWYNRFLFSKIVTNVIANSEATKNTILENNSLLFPSEKIVVLYNGIRIPKKIERKNVEGNNPYIIGTAGRLEVQKNLFSLLEIALHLKEKKYNFIIKIAGEGSLNDQLAIKIDELSLQNHVELCGFQSSMEDFYKQLDVFVLTSYWEGFGFVLAEAMTYNLPLIAYNVSSNVELIKNGYNGFLIQKDSIEEFANTIIMLMQNKNLSLEMGENARKFVEQQFDATKTLLQTEEFLLQL